MPDKFYFTAPEGNASQVVRGRLSELTCMVYAMRDGQTTEEELKDFIKVLQTMDHYVMAPEQFVSLLESDLYNACCYWEEEYRYDDCWPIINNLLISVNRL